VNVIEIAELYRFLPSNEVVASFYPHNSNHNKARWIDWVSGACFLVRREAVDQVGLMDEGYFMYAEDMDWCYRMRMQGWLTFFTPQAQVVHVGGGSSTKTRGKLIVEQYRSLYRFYRKHYSPLALFSLELSVLGITMPKVVLLLLLQRGNVRRRELCDSFWQVICMSWPLTKALRVNNDPAYEKD